MKEIRFDGQVAIVTGANSEIGLGYHYAKLLALRGAKVLLHGRRPDKVNEACAKLRELGCEVEAGICDVTDEEGIKRIVKETADRWGRIDILINNAGGSDGDTWPDFTVENAEKYFRLNVFSSMIFMREVWPYMKKQGYGRIINTSSNSSFGGYAVTSYPVSKAAIPGLVRATAVLGKADNILINGVYPAAFTQLTRQLPEGLFAETLESKFNSEKAAPIVAYLCSKENTEYTGEMYSVGGGSVSLIRLMSTAPENVETIEDMASAIKTMHKPEATLVPAGTAFEDTIRLGMPAEAVFELFSGGKV